jgi:hypothetical protein
LIIGVFAHFARKRNSLRATLKSGLKKLVLPGVAFTSAKQMAKSALTAIQKGQLGYAVLIAAKPDRID